MYKEKAQNETAKYRFVPHTTCKEYITMTNKSQDEIQNIEPVAFDLGAIVVTRGVDAFLNGNHLPLITILDQHKKGYWGLCCEEDAILNNFATHNGDRILSVYELNGEKIWIITECDRSATTVLFPYEY